MRVVSGCAVAVAVLWVSGCVAPTPVEPTTTTSTSIPDAACEVERRTIETAIEAYGADQRVYPESLDVLFGVFLKPPLRFDWTYATTGQTFTLTGPC